MADKHVERGGSNAHLWINCAGYINLARQVPRRPVGIAAIEGTAQHTCMEMLLNNPDLTPDKFLGTTVSGVVITQEHVNAIQIALDAYMDIVESFPEDATLFSEKFVGLRGSDDPDYGGTMDAGVVHGKRGAMIDFKFGQMEVDSSGEQNLFYGVCARKSITAFAGVEEFESYIIQPAYDPAIDKTVYPAMTLDRFEQTVHTAIKLGDAPNPDFTEGEWCGKFCGAKLACPKKLQRLSTLTAPNHILDLEDLGKMVAKLRAWDKWREEAEERIQHELEHGVQVPGWKLVAMRAIRKWIDEAAAIAVFKTKKVKESDYIMTKLISPAGAEKLLPKSEIAKLANPVSSGNTIAPMDDKRQAVLPPAALGQALRRLQ